MLTRIQAITGQDSFQNKLLKGNQKAIQQHFSQSLVQNLGKYLPLLA